MTDEASPADAVPAPTVRLFVALALPVEIADLLRGLMADLRKGFQFAGCAPRWVGDDALHLTLAFLGERPASLVAEIEQALGSAARPFGEQRLEIAHLGVFPHWRRPGVLWAGVRDRTRQLIELHARVNDALLPFDYTPEDRPYRPHVTLARFKSGKGIAAAEKLVHQHDDFRFGPFAANELALFRSELLPSGARYHRLATLGLSARTPTAQEVVKDERDEEIGGE